MAKINGTLMLAYADGILIAAQKGITVNLQQNLFDATTKDSAGWAEHGNGLRSFDVNLDGLCSTTGLSAKELITFMTSRKSLLLVVDGLGTPFVIEANVTSVTVTGASEEAASLSGSLKANGAAYFLAGTSAQLFTAFGADTYDTFTDVGTKINSAINLASGAYARSGAFAISLADVVKVFVFVTTNSGELPSVALINSGGADISNVVALVAGLNVITLTASGADAAGMLQIDNSAAANFSTSNIYCFKV